MTNRSPDVRCAREYRTRRVAVVDLRVGQYVVKIGAATASGPNGRPVEAVLVRTEDGSSARHVVLVFHGRRRVECLRAATATVLDV